MSSATSESEGFISDTDWVTKLKRRGVSDDSPKEKRWGSLEASVPDEDTPTLHLSVESDCDSYMVMFDPATGEPSIVPGNNDQHYRFKRSTEGFSFLKPLKNRSKVDKKLDDGDMIKMGGYKYTVRMCKGAFTKYEVIPGAIVKEGGFGKVAIVRVIGEPKPQYAVKMIPGDHCIYSHWPTYEISTLKALTHPNICKLMDEFATSDQGLHLVMEYVPDTLTECLSSPSAFLSRASESLHPPDVFGGSMLLQICSATKYIHSLGIIHRDIKPDNILVSSFSPLHLKLADFGQAIRSDSPTQKNCGTKEYTAPEAIIKGGNAEKSYDNSVDAYSVGVVFFEILMVTVNYDHMEIYHRSEVLKAKTTYHYVRELHATRTQLITSNLGSEYAEAIQLVQGLLDFEPSDRFSMSIALAHPWLYQMKARLEYSTDTNRSRSPTPLHANKKAKTAKKAITTYTSPESFYAASNEYGVQTPEQGSSSTGRLQKRKLPY